MSILIKVDTNFIKDTSGHPRDFFFLFDDLFRVLQNYILGGSKPCDLPVTGEPPKMSGPPVTGKSHGLEPPRPEALSDAPKSTSIFDETSPTDAEFNSASIPPIFSL